LDEILRHLAAILHVDGVLDEDVFWEQRRQVGLGAAAGEDPSAPN
jgi:hypothetical protein